MLPGPRLLDVMIFRLIVGAVIGAALGWLFGRAKVCSLPGCSARTNLAASVVAGAVFGAAIGYALSGR
jgi:hypothetical protein